jgi:heme oxygenase (biliverdin-IX-beta and delta-forming)
MISRGRAHTQLRQATHSLHQQLDTRLIPSTLVDRPAYVRYLLTNLPCGPIESGLAAAGIRRLLPDWDDRERRVVLGEDLSALDADPGRVPACSIAPDIGTMLGWSYVLEGSRLGAALILRTVETSPDAAVRGATRFLGHGAGRNFWNSFKATLAGIDQDDDAIARACAAAVQAFERFAAMPVAVSTGPAP